jgi:integrase
MRRALGTHSTNLPIRDGVLMQLLFDIGLRKSEARNLRLQHLDTRDLLADLQLITGNRPE